MAIERELTCFSLASVGLDLTSRRDVPVDSVSVEGGALLFAEASERASTAYSYSSRIFRGGIHLRRLVPFKDLLVPSGPLSSFAGT